MDNLSVFAPNSPLKDDFWQASNTPEARKRLVEALHYELLGPSEEDEELFESPVTRYLTGLLAPFGTGVLPSEQDVSLTLGDGDEDTGGGIGISATDVAGDDAVFDRNLVLDLGRRESNFSDRRVGRLRQDRGGHGTMRRSGLTRSGTINGANSRLGPISSSSFSPRLAFVTTKFAMDSAWQN